MLLIVCGGHGKPQWRTVGIKIFALIRKKGLWHLFISMDGDVHDWVTHFDLD